MQVSTFCQNTAAGWAADDPILPEGWTGFESDTNKFKRGTGVKWSMTAYTPSANSMKACLAADKTFNNTAALADTLLAVSLPKPQATQNDRYRIELDIFSTNATKGLKLDFLALQPNGGDAMPDNWVGQWEATAANGTTSLYSGSSVDDMFAPTTGFDAAAGYIRYSFRGSFEVFAGQDNGTVLTLRGAQNSAHASDTVILRGSTLVVTQMN